MSKDVNRLFIVGVGRSGTSLLQSMLASHQQIAMLPETGFVRRYLLCSKYLDNDQIDAYQLNCDKYLARWQASGFDTAKNLEGGRVSLKGLYHQVSSHYINQASFDVNYIAEKDPKLIEGLLRMDQVFSNYRVVHIYRDPRDVVISKRKAVWSKEQSLFKQLVANNSQIRFLEKFELIHNELLFGVKYEELLENPEKVLKGVCEFLGIPFQFSMLEFQEQAKKLATDDEMSWKKETTGPLLRDNSYKWKTDMQPFTANLVETSCSAVMEIGGYERLGSDLNIIFRIVTQLASIFVNFVSAIYVFKSRFC